MAKQSLNEDVLKEFVLPVNKKILIKPIIKKGKWLSEEHSGNFMYDNTKMTITVPLSTQTGQIIDPLTKEEREFFENRDKSGMDFKQGDLNVYKKSNQLTGETNFWLNFEYRLYKNQGVLEEGTTLAELDLSKPMDYITYKVLLANSLPGGQVAPSWSDRFNQGTYRIALVNSKDEDELEASKTDKLAEAFAFYGTIQNSHTKMFELLSVYWLENRKAVRPAKDSTMEFLKKEISKIIHDNVDSFLSLINSNYEEKLLINEALSCGAIRMEGRAFLTADGVPLGETLRQIILYYRDDRNSEQKVKLIAQAEAYKEKKVNKE